jgi:hypothetical protein
MARNAFVPPTRSSRRRNDIPGITNDDAFARAQHACQRASPQQRLWESTRARFRSGIAGGKLRRTGSASRHRWLAMFLRM